MIKTIEERRHYQKIHCWLWSHYGKATKCENPDCPQTCKNFSWSLIKGLKYEKKRDNFKQLCYSCHIKYDSTEEGKERLRKFHTGRKFSLETRLKMGRVRKGIMLGFKHTKESRKKMSEAHKGELKPTLSKKVYQYNLDGKLVEEFISMSDAERKRGFFAGGISMCCNGNQKTYRGYVWSFIPLEDNN